MYSDTIDYFIHAINMNYIVLGVMSVIFLLIFPLKFSPKTYIDISKSIIISNFFGLRLKYTLDNKDVISINGKKLSILKEKNKKSKPNDAQKVKKNNSLAISTSNLFPVESIYIYGVIGIETRSDLTAIAANASNIVLTAIITELLGNVLSSKVTISPLYNKSTLELNIKIKIRTNILRILMLKQG